MTYINKYLQDKFGFNEDLEDKIDEESKRKYTLEKLIPPLKFNNLPIVLRRFAKAFQENKLSQGDISYLRQNLIEFADKHKEIPELASARLYEYEALLLDSQGMHQDAKTSISQAEALLTGKRKLVTDWGEAIYLHESRVAKPYHQKNLNNTPNARKKPIYKRKLFYAALVILLIVAWQPVANWYAVVSATPTQKAMADSLHLTSKGRVIFFETKPQLMDTNAFADVCPSDANEAVEGCYDPNTNRIYVRVMPDELKSAETVTSAHEMLHAAYQKYDTSTLKIINSMVEDQYSSMNDPELTSRVTDYNQSEPGAQDAELYAILGSEFGNLNPDLESEYSKYFTDRQTEISAASETKNTFDAYTSQLDSQGKVIDSENSLADKYYGASISWANAGNAYEDDYYYNLYLNEYNQASRDIDSYNQLVDKYNLLIDEFSGKVYTPLSQPQKSNQ